MIKYVVTSGDCSDYKVKGVFSLKEKAEQYIKIHKIFDEEINEIPEEFIEDNEEIPNFVIACNDFSNKYFEGYRPPEWTFMEYNKERIIMGYDEYVEVFNNIIKRVSVKIKYNEDIEIMIKDAEKRMDILYKEKIESLKDATHMQQLFKIEDIRKDKGIIIAVAQSGKGDGIIVKLNDFSLDIDTTKSFYARSTIDIFGNIYFIDNIKSVEDVEK
ncbi:MAG: hypothetical protein M0R51_10310 [Clostridia bacterium]|jgi:GTP cyclohydrolase II|nr:hypothetical protein [Clostridia bacterium]